MKSHKSTYLGAFWVDLCDFTEIAAAGGGERLGFDAPQDTGWGLAGEHR